MLRDLRVSPAETRRQFLRQLGPVGISHDHGCRGAGPAEIIAVQGREESIDIFLAEPTYVVTLVYVTGRRSDKNQAGKCLGPLRRRKNTDDGAHRMSDEHRG